MTAAAPGEPEVTVTLTFSREVAERLAVLDRDGEEYPLEEQIHAVLDILADAAAQGVRRDGGPERALVCQVFGQDWLAKMEPIPGTPGWWRPRRGGTP